MSPKTTLSVIEAGAKLGEMILANQLQELHLPTFLEHYEALAQDASRASWAYPKYLATLTQKEIDRRTGNRYKQRIKEAHFPLLKELADFDFTAVPKLNKQQVLHLAQGRYLHDAACLLLVGAPGLGKTHIATALGLAACRQGQRVRFYTVANLVNLLIQAQNEQRLSKFIDQALRHQVLILDELGYLPFSTLGAQLLFQFCSALHERVSLIITTNLPFGDWVQIFGDARLTAGLLDRLTYKSHILEFVGDSYRFRQRLAATNQGYPPLVPATLVLEGGAAAPPSSTSK